MIEIYFLCLPNLSIIYHMVYKPIIANYCICNIMEIDFFSILDSAYVILVYVQDRYLSCSRTILESSFHSKKAIDHQKSAWL